MSFARDIKDMSPRWVRSSADFLTREYGLLTSGQRTPPDFVIIGTKRGGTTSLFNYLVQHPGVIRMFPGSRDLKSTDFFFRRGQSEAWYRSHFPRRSDRLRRADELGYAPVCGEASPYYCWDPRVAGFARELAPDVKAILLVRNPVKRAWSHFQERVQNGVEPMNFEDALHMEDERLAGELEKMLEDPTYYSSTYDWYSYRSRGEYLPQIENWLAHFPREQLLILRSEDLYRETQTTFDRVCGFLGLPTVAMPTQQTFNATWRTSEAPPASARDALQAYFLDHNARLEAFLGTPLDW